MSSYKNQLPVDLHQKVLVMDYFEIGTFEEYPAALQVQASRKDFFKIVSINGDYLCNYADKHYADKRIYILGPALLFFHPDIDYSFQQLNLKSTGYVCLFRKTFFSEGVTGKIAQLPYSQKTGNRLMP